MPIVDDTMPVCMGPRGEAPRCLCAWGPEAGISMRACTGALVAGRRALRWQERGPSRGVRGGTRP
eukprot:14273937-Alexandrium_andersonii.AAC.1